MKVQIGSVICLIFTLCGCDSGNLDAAKEKLDKWGAPSAQDVGEVAKSEWDKYWGVEYKIERFSTAAQTAEMQELLNTLGKDRWDCFHIEHRGDEYLLFCKRLPTSYLRYLTKAF